MRRRVLVTTLAGWLAGALGVAVAGDCPPVIFNACRYGFPTGIGWFGQHWNGDNLGSGQSVTFECPTRLLGIELQFSLPGVGNHGVPPLLPGDEVVMSILDAGYAPLATTTALLTAPGPGDQDLQWILFDFTAAGLELAPGRYVLAAYTDLPRQCGVSYCTEDDYAGGTRLGFLAGLGGPWHEDPGRDLTFRVLREPLPVSGGGVTWSALKAAYR